MFYTDAADRHAQSGGPQLNSTVCADCGHVGGHHAARRAGCDCCTCRSCPAWCDVDHGKGEDRVHCHTFRVPITPSDAVQVVVEQVEDCRPRIFLDGANDWAMQPATAKMLRDALSAAIELLAPEVSR